jgi:hypothetical protein
MSGRERVKYSKILSTKTVMSNDECLKLTINEDYAKKYEERKKGEELSKCRLAAALF